MRWFIELIIVFFAWTFLTYWLHRLAHIKSKYNILYKLHTAHHEVNYFKGGEKFSIGYLFFYFGDIRVTVDVLLTITLPLILLTFLYPSQGLVLLVFHYLHEVFLSERLLDHNPKIKGYITHYFAWGSYHLEHHRNPRSNYSAFVTLWDKIFRTQKIVR